MDSLFQVHMLNEAGKKKAKAIADAFDALLAQLTTNPDSSFDVLCPPGREQSIMKTKLEEAAFFAKKAMARCEENQETRSGAV